MSNNSLEISKLSISFMQDGNTLGTTNKCESITLDLEFQLGVEDGPFYVFKTDTGWSIDNVDDIQNLLDIADAALDEIKKKNNS